ncbi:MAG TPA: tRNA-uridine aminocarboxypropyltransferase [Fibrobacteraceae bacterium]|nr:tRNA-uridine aminocarboxypropyltransferase [Fibrobacteraceae bacterium]
MSPSRGFRIPRCAVCQLPQDKCICKHLSPILSDISLVLLQHRKEIWRSSGTGNLVLRCFANAKRLAPEDVDAFLNEAIIEDVVLLFPPDGEEIQGPSTSAHPSLGGHPRILLVPDGSWSEARRMVRKNPRLRSLPRISPPIGSPWIRNPLRQDKWERPCTAEAIGRCFEAWGQKSIAQQLRRSLQLFVDAHWQARGGIPKPD